jgi:hypothetical protein
MNQALKQSLFSMTTLGGVVLGTLCSCSSPSKIQTGSPGSYTEKLDAWRCSSRALEEASKGDEDAIRACFLSAYVRVNEPLMGGEDLEAMDMTFAKLLKNLGDDKFSEALQTVRPEVRSSVHWFFKGNRINKTDYPKTFATFASAPNIDWPLDQAYRQG